MSRLDRSQRALAATAGLTALLAALPAGWLRWTGLLAEIVGVPTQPLVDLGVRTSRWLRPADRELAVASSELKRRITELETTRALLHAERLKNEALREEIEALQEARRLNPGVEMTPLYARVTGRPPDRASGPVRINAGARHGVAPGTVAVYRGGHVVGRVGEGVGRLSSRVVPVTDPSIGLIEVVVLPAGDPTAALEGAPRLQLAPDGAGALVGDLDRAVEVHAGDVARLVDPAWPESAQGKIVGTVESVTGRDLRPLLNAVTIRPKYELQRLASLTLIVERVDAALGGGER